MTQQQPRLSGPAKRFHIHVSSTAGKLLAIAIGAALFVLAIVLSLALLAFLLVGAVLVAGFFWWRIRALRKRAFAHRRPGSIIEGELIDDTAAEGESSRRE